MVQPESETSANKKRKASDMPDDVEHSTKKTCGTKNIKIENVNTTQQVYE